MALRQTIELNKIFKHEVTERRVNTAGQRRINDYLHHIHLRALQEVGNPYGEVVDEDKFRLMESDTNYLFSLPESWDWSWSVQSGEYRGKIAKRIAQFYRDNYGVELSPQTQERIGTEAANHRTEPATYYLDFTNNLDWNAGDFGDSQSCFWQSRTKDRYTLMYNQVWAVRLYKDSEGTKGFARAWIAPDTPKENCFILFNGYGFEGDSTLDVAKIVAAHLGFGMRELEIRNKGERTAHFFFNGDGRGIVVGAEADLQQFNYQPSRRGRDSWQRYDFRWATNVVGQCAVTGEWLSESDWHHHHRGRYYSREGYDQYFAECTVTGNPYPRDELVTLPSGALVCEQAWREMTIPCHYCTQRELKERFHWLNGSALMVCQDCFDRHCVECEHTHQTYLREDTRFIEGNGFYSDEGIRHWADLLMNEIGVVPQFNDAQFSALQDAHVLNTSDIESLSHESVALGIQDAIAAGTLKWDTLGTLFHPQALLSIKCYNALWWNPLAATQREQV